MAVNSVQTTNHVISAFGSVNRGIIAAVVIIIAIGIYRYFLQQGGSKAAKSAQSTTLTRITVGGFMLAIFASIFDLVGGGVGRISFGLLMLAVLVQVSLVITDIAGRYSKNTTVTADTAGGGHPTFK